MQPFPLEARHRQVAEKLYSHPSRPLACAADNPAQGLDQFRAHNENLLDPTA